MSLSIQEYFKSRLQLVIEEAKCSGVEVTIDVVSQQPLAMRNKTFLPKVHLCTDAESVEKQKNWSDVVAFTYAEKLSECYRNKDTTD